MESKLKGIPRYRLGDAVDDLFVVRFKKPLRKTSQGKWFFRLKLQDAEGSIMLSYWGSSDKSKVQQLYDSIKPDDVVKVTGGFVREFNKNLEFSVNEGEGKLEVLKQGEFDPRDFIRYSKKKPAEMWADVLALLSGVQDPDLQKIRDSFIKDAQFVEAFKRCPAAMYRHHGWMHGLLEHTLTVMKLCDELSKVFDLNRDLILVGAFLHDIGKLKEFEVTTQIKVSDRGNLLGHIVLGLEMFIKKTEGLNISELTRDKLMHMMASHHGKLEYGSPKIPMFPEALVLHRVDELDSSVTEMKTMIEDAYTEDSFVYKRDYGNIYLK